MKLPNFITKAAADVENSGITASFFNFFQGRATTFAIVFTVVGIILAFRGKLDTNYSLFVTAVQGLIFAHSCKEDWNAQRMSALRNDPVNVEDASKAPTQGECRGNTHV
jgi:hypothetical protein